MMTGDKYEGFWSKGKKNGKGICSINLGTYIFINGDVYHG